MTRDGERHQRDLRRLASLLLGSRAPADTPSPGDPGGGVRLPVVAVSGTAAARALAAAIGAAGVEGGVRVIEDRPAAPWHRQVDDTRGDGEFLLLAIDPLETARLGAAALGASGALLWIDDPARQVEAREALATLAWGLAGRAVAVIGAMGSVPKNSGPTRFTGLLEWHPGRPLGADLLSYLGGLPPAPVSAAWCAGVLEAICPDPAGWRP